MSPQQEADIILQQWQSLRDVAPDKRITAIEILEDAQSREINPWFLAIAISGWLWAAVWFVAWVIV